MYGSRFSVDMVELIIIVWFVSTKVAIYNFIFSSTNIIQLVELQQMDMINKVAVCLCCTYPACQVAQCIDVWASCEAYGLSCLECGHCCWTICAPICHKSTVGQTGEGLAHCTKGIKYCLYGCALECVAPFDGCYNCIMYIIDICGSGVTGFSDVLKHTQWLNKKVKAAFELQNGSQPLKSLKEYAP